MLENKLSHWLHFWFPKALPLEQIIVKPGKIPSDPAIRRRMYFRKWLVHPVKRRAAKAWVYILQEFFGLTVIGITGSAGKTTTKEMLASILSLKGKAQYSYANIDPVYNIPTTILKCSPKTRYLILEMGIEYPGEMEFYGWMVRPDIAIITNISATHTEFFGDERGVYKEKIKLLSYCKNFCVLNKDNKYLINTKLRGLKTLWFGKSSANKVLKTKVKKDGYTNCVLQVSGKKHECQLPFLGGHFCDNALAAFIVAHKLGIKPDIIKQGLRQVAKPEHRMNVIKHKSGAFIIDDSYNNNPEAAKKTIATFTKLYHTERKVVIFGDMLELGRLETESHRQIGKLLARKKIDKLICVGDASYETYLSFNNKNKAKSVAGWKAAKPLFKKELRSGTAILIKGSRSVGLDNLVDA